MYEEEKEFNVLKGKIPDFDYDIKMLSVVVDGEKSKEIPSRGLYKTQIDCSNGTRGEWDYNAWNLTLENVSENARCNITFTSNLSEEEYDKYIEAGKALRRNTYRGKDITNYHTDGSLYEMISSGRFDDIYVGDYIVANNVTWLVADIDNYFYSGTLKHHVTIIPAIPLINGASRMHDINSTEGGYIASEMAQKTLISILNGTIIPVFGNHVIEYFNLLTNEINGSIVSGGFGTSKGASSSFQVEKRKLDLMGEVNVFGSRIFSSSGHDIGYDNHQYAIFRLKPEFIHSYKSQNFAYWLKDIARTDCYVYVDVNGNSHATFASQLVYGVRPRFLIG